MNTIIKVKCLKHIYPDKTEVDICGLDFIVNKGDRVVILGPNGTGKTTLLSHILGILKPVDGQISVFGVNPFKEFKHIRKKIGVVFQNVDEQIIGPTVYDDIAFSLRNAGMSKELVRDKVYDIAKTLEIEDILGKIPHYLSGGQKKKVALAGALSMSPELLIMDEPFDGLDPKSKKEMIELINALNRDRGVTTIITTHDVNIVTYIADLIYIINKGRIVSSGDPEEIFKQSDVLKEANLEPPILIQLFDRLAKKGYNVNIPIDIDQAEEEIYRLINAQKCC
ncbi:MAG: ATP-binding cassette domain-containing protein [Clostridiaceae bacterium]|nr:ATP-binding cassette domain-containing protein [Clostridiaceae bacterium]